MEVTPARTFSSASSRNVRMPSARAVSPIWSADELCSVSSRMASEMGMIS